jgi:hypothetical protein
MYSAEFKRITERDHLWNAGKMDSNGFIKLRALRVLRGRKKKFNLLNNK